jgi:hypothetical protein
MKQLKLLSAILFFTLTASAQSKDDGAIRGILSQQALAWNGGDIEKFMQPYWHSDSLMFIGKSGITYGWQQTLERYKKNYPDAATMGKLDYELLQVKRLSVLYYAVTGKWHLTRSVGDVEGYFTLLIKKIKNEWVIISDHSS